MYNKWSEQGGGGGRGGRSGLPDPLDPSRALTRRRAACCHVKEEDSEEERHEGLEQKGCERTCRGCLCPSGSSVRFWPLWWIATAAVELGTYLNWYLELSTFLYPAFYSLFTLILAEISMMGQLFQSGVYKSTVCVEIDQNLCFIIKLEKHSESALLCQGSSLLLQY